MTAKPYYHRTRIAELWKISSSVLFRVIPWSKFGGIRVIRAIRGQFTVNCSAVSFIISLLQISASSPSPPGSPSAPNDTIT